MMKTDSPTSQDETSDFTKKRERPKRKKRKAKEKEKRGGGENKNERKREKGQCYYLFFHTCASK